MNWATVELREDLLYLKLSLEDSTVKTNRDRDVSKCPEPKISTKMEKKFISTVEKNLDRF